jgi:hypothetical protein
MNIELISYVFMGVCLLYIVYHVVTKGFKGALFKGKIIKTYGEFKTLPVSGLTNRMRIHEIDSKPEPTIGIEIAGPFEVTPIRLDKKDIPRFIEILKASIKGS